jgi:protein-S-isoprenylcysteine O-methyltransferase Ste14
MNINTAIFSVIITALWVAFILYWLISAMTSKRSLRTGMWRRSAAIRIAFVIVIFLLIHFGIISGVFLRSFWLTYGVSPLSPFVAAIGVLVCAAGIAFAVWARIYLGRNWGMPMTLRQDHELVTSGPYTLVRHPIYTGFLLAMLGSALADGLGWLLFFVFAGIYFIYSAKVEEKMMIKQFPNEYPDYMKRTKLIVPYLI